jgi:hypothetical protein
MNKAARLYRIDLGVVCRDGAAASCPRRHEVALHGAVAGG